MDSGAWRATFQSRKELETTKATKPAGTQAPYGD